MNKHPRGCAGQMLVNLKTLFNDLITLYLFTIYSTLNLSASIFPNFNPNF